VLWLSAFVIAVFAVVALVAGLLIGLSDVLGPWWATAIVVGGLVLITLILIQVARRFWRRMTKRLFGEDSAR
ncbi:MAG: hypothetical protein RLZZ136_1714, partial [Pseudomonadota bacterium]